MVDFKKMVAFGLMVFGWNPWAIAAPKCLNVEDQMKALASQPAQTRVTVATSYLGMYFSDDLFNAAFIKDLKAARCTDASAMTVADLHLSAENLPKQKGCDSLTLNGQLVPVTDFSETFLEISIPGQNGVPYKVTFEKAGDSHMLQSTVEIFTNHEESHIIKTTHDIRWGAAAPGDSELSSLTTSFCK